MAANNDFSNPVPEVREAQTCYVRELIRMTAELGADRVRVFLAWWGVTRHPQLATYDIAEGYWPLVHEKFADEEIWGWCREALIECARYAGEMGVMLALQNHKPIIKDHQDVLRMVREVGSPHLKVCLDVPLMPDKSTAAIFEAARAVGPLQALSHFGGEFDRNPDGSITGVDRIDGVVTGQTNQYYRDFARAMREIGYDGYISYELCHQLPMVNGETVGIEFAHKNAQLAAEFMREIVKAECGPSRRLRGGAGPVRRSVYPSSVNLGKVMVHLKPGPSAIRGALIGWALLLWSSAIHETLCDAGAANHPPGRPFKVVAFYTGKSDPAHISFVREANKWFPEVARQNGFTYDSTNDWTQLNPGFLARFQVVVFLDSRPDAPAQRAAFKQYMENGGAWMGFHFAGFALTPSKVPQNWDWYHNEFLGAGSYAGNTWRPTSAVLRVEDRKHPATDICRKLSFPRPMNGTDGRMICGRTLTSRSSCPLPQAVSRSEPARTHMRSGTGAITRWFGRISVTE